MLLDLAATCSPQGAQAPAQGLDMIGLGAALGPELQGSPGQCTFIISTKSVTELTLPELTMKNPRFH